MDLLLTGKIRFHSSNYLNVGSFVKFTLTETSDVSAGGHASDSLYSRSRQYKYLFGTVSNASL